MAKKKSKDFQKVRIKVGRKLKRRNETVVKLTSRKIILPKEKKQNVCTLVFGLKCFILEFYYFYILLFLF